MELLDIEPRFDTLRPTEKILLVAWVLHARRGLDVFDNAAVRDVFRGSLAEPPDVTVYIPRMATSRPASLVKTKGGYRLEGATFRALDKKYGIHPTVVAVTKLLEDLPSKVPGTAEKVFLQETIACYRSGSFRAAIVMAWNLAYGHLRDWIVSDRSRLATFNATLAARNTKKAIVIGSVGDFDDLKESEVIEICRVGRIIGKNIADILREKLGRRNKAAHPSGVVFTQHQADDTITDLVNNIVLGLV